MFHYSSTFTPGYPRLGPNAACNVYGINDRRRRDEGRTDMTYITFSSNDVLTMNYSRHQVLQLMV